MSFLPAEKNQRLWLFYLFAVLAGLALYHYCTKGFLYFDEDEANYIAFAHGRIGLDSGVLWKLVGHYMVDALGAARARLIPLALGIGLLAAVGAAVWRVASPALAVLVVVLLGISSSFINEAHRVRPEILHTCLAAMAFAVLVYVRPAQNYFAWRGLMGWAIHLPVILLISMVFQTHAMAINHLPGLVLLYIAMLYGLYGYGWRRAMVTGVVVFIALFLLWMIAIPDFALKAGAIIADPSKVGAPKDTASMGLISRMANSFHMFFAFWREFHAGTTPFMPSASTDFLNYGRYITYESWGLITLTVLGGVLFLASLLKKRFAFSNTADVAFIACWANIATFLATIFVFNRLHPCYYISFLPWALIGFAIGFHRFLATLPESSRVRRHQAILLATLPVVLVMMMMAIHHTLVVWPYRANNFVETVNEINEKLDLVCKDRKAVVSSPYYAFVKNATSLNYAYMIANVPSKESALELFGKQQAEGNCLAIRARHYFGMGSYSQIPWLKDVRAWIDTHYEPVAIIDKTFYKNDPFELFWYEGGLGEKWPGGIGTTLFKGVERVFIMRPKPVVAPAAAPQPAKRIRKKRVVVPVEEGL